MSPSADSAAFRCHQAPTRRPFDVTKRRLDDRSMSPSADSAAVRRHQAPTRRPFDVTKRRLGGQYAGCEGATWLPQAATPPPTWTASAYPAPLTIARVSAERTPVLQCMTTCLSDGSCSSAEPLRKSPLGMSTEPGILLISYSLGSRTSTRTKSRSPLSRSLSHCSNVVTEIVASAAASAASSLTAPQNVS